MTSKKIITKKVPPPPPLLSLQSLYVLRKSHNEFAKPPKVSISKTNYGNKSTFYNQTIKFYPRSKRCHSSLLKGCVTANGAYLCVSKLFNYFCSGLCIKLIPLSISFSSISCNNSLFRPSVAFSPHLTLQKPLLQNLRSTLTISEFCAPKSGAFERIISFAAPKCRI